MFSTSNRSLFFFSPENSVENPFRDSRNCTDSCPTYVRGQKKVKCSCSLFLHTFLKQKSNKEKRCRLLLCFLIFRQHRRYCGCRGAGAAAYPLHRIARRSLFRAGGAAKPVCIRQEGLEISLRPLVVQVVVLSPP